MVSIRRTSRLQMQGKAAYNKSALSPKSVLNLTMVGAL